MRVCAGEIPRKNNTSLSVCKRGCSALANKWWLLSYAITIVSCSLHCYFARELGTHLAHKPAYICQLFTLTVATNARIHVYVQYCNSQSRA